MGQHGHRQQADGVVVDDDRAEDRLPDRAPEPLPGVTADGADLPVIRGLRRVDGLTPG
jgi:hypothetical protein